MNSNFQLAKLRQIRYILHMRNLEAKVREYIDRYQMIGKGDRVIAGISGGADSVCLFFVLLKLQRAMGFSIIAVHVNHGLRGADADADERFVKDLCEKYKVPLEISRVDLESIAKKRKQSLEEAGRDVRREIFTQTMIQYSGNRIALAHHQNDNAETLLWNLARGTGLHGLCGIRPVNGKWIRPLLCLSRQEIEVYLKERNQAYCIDSTNLETFYTRNKLRHQVIPILETGVNSAAVRHMNETMEQICELREFVGQETQKALAQCVDVTESGYRISMEGWKKLPSLLQKEVIYSCIGQIGGGRKDLGRVHVEAVAGLFDKQVGKMRNLPGEIRAVRDYAGVVLEKSSHAEAEQLPQGKSGESCRKTEGAGNNCRTGTFPEVEIQIPGITVVPEMNLKIETRILETDDGFKLSEIKKKKFTKWFDYDIMKCLYIRTRKSGDSIVIDSGGHRQKLKSWFVNEKIPANERSRIPLFADGQQIVWVVGHRMSGAYQVSGRTKRILQIEVKKQMKKLGGQEDGRGSSCFIIGRGC